MKSRVYGVLLCALAIMSVSCARTPASQAAGEPVPASVAVTISAAEFREGLVSDPDALLLDVRTVSENEESRLEGAVLIPVGELTARIDEIAEYREQTVYIYCRSGSRSRTAAALLLEAGFSSVVDLEGGIGSWLRTGFPVITGAEQD
jgi:rhodanese-related sulfurtransferase